MGELMTRYIWTLPEQERREILAALLGAGIGGEDLERALDGRICDLEDTIDIETWR